MVPAVIAILSRESLEDSKKRIDTHAYEEEGGRKGGRGGGREGGEEGMRGEGRGGGEGWRGREGGRGEEEEEEEEEEGWKCQSFREELYQAQEGLTVISECPVCLRVLVEIWCL